jgi:cytochrome c553
MMNKVVQSIIGFGLCSLFYSPVFAANSVADVSKVKACFACHGEEGNSSNAAVPTLAGQQPVYLVNQLTAFRDNKRSSPVMLQQAKNLQDNEIAEIAAYFSGRQSKSAGGNAALAKLGEAKAARCSGCHAGSFAGHGMLPRLAGQQPAYLAKQLHNFKAGERKSGPMQAIAANLSESDIEELAAYLGSL